jgi:hypothetical protein
MKKFLMRSLLFALLLVVPIILGLILPATPKASTSFLFAGIQKDSLLANTDPPRIIFIGGSNLSFGLNSQMVKDSLNMNPINTGIVFDLGLKYMLDNTFQYIRKGDILILALEYVHFTRNYDCDSESLLRMVLDVDKKKFRLLNVQQIMNLFPYIPKYSLSKFILSEYSGFNREIDIYSKNAFNVYGDTDAHWHMEKLTFSPDPRLGKINQQIIVKIKEFEQNVEKKGAVLYLSYPGYQDKSFYISADRIAEIHNELRKNFNVLGTPVRYMMPDSLMFNTSYHLIKKGVDLRTKLLIEDIKNVTSNQK